MPPTGIPKTNNIHPNTRRKVIATADVQLMQVQVVDKVGKIRSIVVWRCGPDILWADTLDAMFDASRRKAAPPWLIEQLDSLPIEQQFTSTGQPKQAAAAASSGPTHVPGVADTDLPDFAQA